MTAGSLLCLVGPQPPPRHGVSSVNEAVLGLAEKSGLTVRTFNTAPVFAKRNLVQRFARLWPVIRAAWDVRKIARANPGTVVYCSISGGLGILGEMMVVWAARGSGARSVLHHHSFRYLDRPFMPMKWLARIAGPGAVHVVLGANMGQALRRGYASVARTLVVSNAAFIGQSPPPPENSRPECRVIGHLSNLSADKGLFDLVDLAEWAQRENLDFEFRIAGPFANENVRREFESRSRELKNIRLLGPLYGGEKIKFFGELDVFVFPTRYFNEAEPLVLHEALGRGCPVISYDRGCISALIDSNCGVLIPRDEAFLPPASAALRQWRTDGHQVHRRRAAREKFDRLFVESTGAQQKLLHILSGKALQPEWGLDGSPGDAVSLNPNPRRERFL